MTGRGIKATTHPPLLTRSRPLPCPFHFNVALSPPPPRPVEPVFVLAFACPPRVEKLCAFSLRELHRVHRNKCTGRGWKGRETKRRAETRGRLEIPPRAENGENRLTVLLYEPNGASCVVHVKKALTLLLLLCCCYPTSIASSSFHIFIFSTRSFLAYIIT